MPSYIFENARIVDGSNEDGEHDRFVRVSGNVIDEVSDKPIRDSNAHRFDLRGKTLMPGLIDCHVHINSGVADPAENSFLPNELVAYHSVRILKGMLNRGFTTVRDLGGATVAQVHAIEQGVIEGPRLVICGKAMVQTGGHSDYRTRYDMISGDRQLDQLGSVGRIVDGVDDCRRAARDEVRKGARFIKVMANGGAASSHFPRPYLGYSMDELRAFQDEADKAKMYVSVHTHTDEAVARALECGIHSIEHATLITPQTAATAAKQGAIVTPTIAAYEAQIREADALKLDPGFVERLKWVRARGPESLETMRAAGVKLAYGTDVLGSMHSYQSEEFLIRAEALPAIEVIKSATLTAAELVRMEGKVGTIAAGAFADLLVVDKDPVKDLSALGSQGRYMSAIMKDGAFVKNQLAA
ncbi:amidohydrolase family protein [Mesorhizobium sp. XAP10]|uniref:metal-dependent hydrolase family protein n=1 Tax=unclassified Mesorhizobium TaxID=325217 RepID=UPI0023DFEAD5|nr:MULTISPECIES: amidohydrolase family protein [unclassified Mesorhizobium]MDF3156079.1 amidohydrolase family protein [Mesorhizobium sp. XAP10]MDF3248906.1 amidohydrolase family protein [Mesorhizobium sp. XAP4]